MKDTLRYLAGIAGPSGYGSKSTAEQVTQCSSFSSTSQLTAIITGATSGIGAETARVLAKRGVRIVMPARDMKKAAQVKEAIQRESPEAEIIVCEIDLSSLASVQSFCNHFLALRLPLNILINNAGVFSKNLEFSEDKVELTFATNYLGHYFLTETLYNGTRAYAQSKLANILHAKEVSRQLQGRNARVTINAVHPGIVKTAIIRAHKGFITDSLFFMASKLLKTTSQGASTTCYVALSSQTEGKSGKFYADCNETNCSSLANDELEAQKLWTRTRNLINKQLSKLST
ncbi:Short-chain dehydrogenase TIC 32 B, chloroplastic, partial [Cucurbita argyrosperma subsp. sororia]